MKSFTRSLICHVCICVRCPLPSMHTVQPISSANCFKMSYNSGKAALGPLRHFSLSMWAVRPAATHSLSLGASTYVDTCDKQGLLPRCCCSLPLLAHASASAFDAVACLQATPLCRRPAAGLRSAASRLETRCACPWSTSCTVTPASIANACALQVAATAPSGKVVFDTVYAFGDAPPDASARFVAISTQGVKLRLTPGHCVPTASGECRV